MNAGPSQSLSPSLRHAPTEVRPSSVSFHGGKGALDIDGQVVAAAEPLVDHARGVGDGRRFALGVLDLLGLYGSFGGERP